MSQESLAEVATKATKTQVLVDCRVVAEIRQYGYGWRTIEQNAKEAESRCKDFNEFIRDHRSQDDIRLEVERIFADRCSNCGADWEPFTEDGRTACANCDMELDL